MSNIIGSVAVSVVPSAEGFNSELREQIIPGAEDLGREIGEEIRQGIEEALEGIRVTVTGDFSQPDAEADELKAKLSDLDTKVDIDADATEANAVIDDTEARLEGLGADGADITLDADPEPAVSAVDIVEEKLARLVAQAAEIEIGADDADAERVLANIRGQLDALTSRVEEVAIGVEDENADAQLASLNAILDRVQTRLDALAASAAGAGDAMAAAAAEAAPLPPELDAVAIGAAAARAALSEFSAEAGTAGGSASGLQSTLVTLRSELGGAEMGDSLTVTKTGLNEFSVAAQDADESLAGLGSEAQKTASDLDSLGGGGGEGGLGGGFMGAILGIAAALGPAFIAAGAAEAIFAGTAIPDIIAIKDHLGPYREDLAEIKSEYLQLSAAVKPEVISDFDIALDQAKEILPEFTGAAVAGSKALGGFEQQLGDFAQSGNTKDFLSFVSGAAAGDVHAFADLIQGGATAVEGFSESLNGISQTLINVAGGVLSFGGDVLEDVPWLGQWAAAVTGMYLAATKLPALLESISTSNFAQWLSGSTDGLKALGAAYTAAAAGEAPVSAEMAALSAETAAVTAETAALSAEVAGLLAELTVMDPELAGLDAGLAALDAEMAATAVEGGVLAGVLGVLDAVNPLVWVAGAVVALGVIADKMAESGSATDSVTEAMARNDDATGSNAAGYEKLSAQLSGTNADMVATKQSVDDTTSSLMDGVVSIAAHKDTLLSGLDALSVGAASWAVSLGHVGQAQRSAAASALVAKTASGQLTAEQVAADAPLAAYADHLQALQQKYGLTTTGAIALARGAGVSAAALEATGSAGEKAMAKIEAYANAGAKASSDTVQYAVDMSLAEDSALGLTARVQALTTALGLESNATDSAIGNAVTYQQSMTTLAQDMKTSGDRAGYLTAQQQATASAIADADQKANAQSASILQVTGSYEKAAGPLEALLGLMEKIKDPTQAETELIQELKTEIDGLQNKDITIGVHVEESSTGGSVEVPVNMSGTTSHNAAAGWYVTGGRPGVDSVPVLAQQDELIVPVPMVKAGEVDHLRGRIPGFEAGGVVGGGASMTGSTAFDFQLFMSIADAAQGDYSTSKTGVSDADRLAREFADGTLKTVTEIRDAGTQAITALKDYYTGPHQAELVGVMSKQVTALENLAQKSATIASEISGMKAYAAQETSSLSGFADLSSIQPGTDASGNALPVTSSTISSALAADLATLRQFVAVIKQLQAAKVSKTLINQVIALGPAQGVVYGQAILAAGPALIKQLNADETQISAAETQVGAEAADVQYGVTIGKGIGTGFLASLGKEEAAIKKEMAAYGDAIAEELEKALHGKVKLSGVTASSVSSALSSSAAASAVSVGGTTSAASDSAATSADIGRLIAAADQINDTEKLVLSAVRTQTSQLLAALKALPRNEAAQIGPAVATALNGVAQKAAQAARTSTR